MKKVISTLLVLGLAVVFAGVLACGGGDDGKEDTTPAGDVQTQDNQTPDVPDKDTKVPDVPADVPAGDVPAEDAPAKDVPVEDVVPGAACVNAADDPLLDTEEERDEVKAVAQSCGIGCLAHPDVTGCASKCMNDQTGLSVGCSACYVDIILCSKDDCLAECMAAPDSQECFDCQTANGCYEAFYACSGLTPME